MVEPILDPDYWEKRLLRASSGHLHHSIFQCPPDRWKRIEAKHREVLTYTIHPLDNILDVGCGWGRLLTLMPDHWVGDYLGIDICRKFIEMARVLHTGRVFLVGGPESLELFEDQKPDWAVLISIKQMMINNLGEAYWDGVQKKIETQCHRILILEYDENSDGEVILCQNR